ncbi:MAG: hypothetical protein ACTSU5_05045 [Promethearchaeota archaeon]
MFTFLAIMIFSFYYCVVWDRPNLIAFLVVVVACFTIITIFLVGHVFIGLVMMVVGGLFGFLTDFWGVGNDVFQYEPGTITLYVLLSGELGNGGVPFEIVASYFFASMWLAQIIESLFDEEIEDLIAEYDEGVKLVGSYKQMIPALVVVVVSLVFISVDNVLIQPWGYFSMGVVLTSLVPGDKKIIPIVFGVIMGAAGLFFELFCSGEILPGVVIWTYSNPDWSFYTTYRAIIAYGGVGASLASTFLLLLKVPAFRKEVSIISLIRKRS